MRELNTDTLWSLLGCTLEDGQFPELRAEVMRELARREAS